MRRPFDLVVVGMGSGGIVAAEAAAAFGLSVAAVERARVGGDCLWTGCVPSKALLASAKAAHVLRTADRFGLPAAEPQIDRAQVWDRIRGIQAGIAATDDDPARFRELGIEIVSGSARLTGPRTVAVDGRRLETRFILLCTGSRPSVPPIPGLAEAGFLTNESLFELERPPGSLVVVGGGPIAVELAQGLRRLGVRVSLLELLPQLLAREEPELAEILTRVLEREGVRVELDVVAQRVSAAGGLKIVEGTQRGQPVRLEGEEVLVAAGRAPNVTGLGLEEVGVELGPRGVVVDRHLRTSVRSIYAAGDVAGRFLFTHSAAHEGAVAVRNMFFPGKARAPDLVPWCTFTDPELAHVGLTAAEARDRHGADRVEVRRADLARSDRARADGASEGAIVLVLARDRLAGAHVLAPAAGELIHELALAVRERKRLRDLAGLVHVYPTISTSVARLAAEAAFEHGRRFRALARRWPA